MAENKRIIHVLIVFCAMFFLLIAYLTYFQLFIRESLKNHAADPRTRKEEQKITRGIIYDKNGVILANNDAKNKRRYPYDHMYCHVIGYNSLSYGKTNLELCFNDELLNKNTFFNLEDISKTLTGENKVGNNLYLTIDHEIQKLAYNLLGNDVGSIVAISPKTGEVIAMVSRPGYNPNEEVLSNTWRDLQESELHPFIPRATSGLYAPGSTFKVLVAASAIENGMQDFEFNDEGKLVIEGNTIYNSGRHAYGYLDLSNALAVSSNIYFAKLGLELGEKSLKDIAERAGFNKSLPFDLPVTDSKMQYSSMSKNDIAACSYGQGKLLVTPMLMACITSAIANKGTMMKPYIVKSVVSPDGDKVRNTTPSPLWNIMSETTAKKLTNLMIGVVENGTAQKAMINGIKVAGKTGTAENEKPGKEHAWFICFAPANDPKIAVAVVKEYSGSYGASCVPIAKDIINAYLNRK